MRYIIEVEIPSADSRGNPISVDQAETWLESDVATALRDRYDTGVAILGVHPVPTFEAEPDLAQFAALVPAGGPSDE